MARLFVGFLLLVSIVGVACGTAGNAEPTTRPHRTATPVAPSGNALTPSAIDAAAGRLPSRSHDSNRTTAAGLLPVLLNSALSGPAGGVAGVHNSSDPELEAFLLREDELPAGYRQEGVYTFSMPDGISGGGTVDMAGALAMKGDPETSPDASVLVSMAMRFEDLQNLEELFGESAGLTEEELLASIDEAGGEGLAALFGDLHVLDASTLGDAGFGMSMTLDFGELIGAFGAPPDDADLPEKMTMRMYFFARGNYAGALMRVSMGGTLPGEAADLALAEIIDGRLAAAVASASR